MTNFLVVIFILQTLGVFVYLGAFIYLVLFLKKSFKNIKEDKKEIFHVVNPPNYDPTKKTFYNPSYGTFEVSEKRKAKSHTEREEALYERNQKGDNVK